MSINLLTYLGCCSSATCSCACASSSSSFAFALLMADCFSTCFGSLGLLSFILISSPDDEDSSMTILFFLLYAFWAF